MWKLEVSIGILLSLSPSCSLGQIPSLNWEVIEPASPRLSGQQTQGILLLPSATASDTNEDQHQAYEGGKDSSSGPHACLAIPSPGEPPRSPFLQEESWGSKLPAAPLHSHPVHHPSQNLSVKSISACRHTVTPQTPTSSHRDPNLPTQTMLLQVTGSRLPKQAEEA